MKKALGIILSVILFMSVLPMIPVSAYEDVYVADGFTYLIEEAGVVIYSAQADSDTLYLPETIGEENYVVNGFDAKGYFRYDDPAEEDYEEIKFDMTYLRTRCKKIVLSDSIEFIDITGLGSPENPIEIVLGRNCRKIINQNDYLKGYNPFRYITIDLGENEHFKIENGMLIEGAKAIAPLGDPAELIFPENITELGDFSFLKSAKNISIPKTVEVINSFRYGDFEELIFEKRTSDIYIAGECFIGCDNVSELEVPNYVVKLDEAGCLFMGMKGLKKVSFAENFNKEMISPMLFSGCKSLEYISIPKSVKEIGFGAFENCGLYNITIPATIDKIDNLAFRNCKKLNKVAFKSRSSDIKLGWGVFENCEKLKTLTVPAYLSTKSDGCFANITGLETVKFAKKYKKTKLPKSIFSGCKDLEEIAIPESVKSIPSAAFLNCEDLEKVSFSKNCKTIGERAFYGCKKLESIALPKSCNEIYKWAFYGCKDLEKATIRGNVKALGYGAFTRCQDLEEVSFKGKYLNKFSDYVFYNAKSLKKITISNTKNAPSFTKKTFKGAANGIRFYVKNKTVAKKLKANLKKAGYNSVKIYANGKLYK